MNVYLIAALLILFTVFSAMAVKKELSGASPCAESVFDSRRTLFLLALCAIALVGIAIRVWKFGSVPDGINQDGAMAAVDGKALADYGTDRFGTRLPCHLEAWGYGQMSCLLSYLIAASVKLFGFSTVTVRLPQLLASLAGGVFFCLLVKNVFGRRACVIAAALAAISPWHFMQSRWVLDCNLLPHFFIAALYFLERGISAKRFMLYIAMLLFGLCMYCYGITIYILPPLLLFLGIFLLAKNRISPAELILCIAVYLLVAWPFILTMLVNFFGWDTIELPFVSIQLFAESTRSKDILFFADRPLWQLGQNAKCLASVLLLQTDHLPWNCMEGFGIVYLFTLPLAVAGLIVLCRRKTVGARLVLAALAFSVLSGLITGFVNINRLNIALYFLILLTALGTELLAAKVKHSTLPTAAAFALSAVLMLGCYFGPYAISSAPCFYAGFGDALAAAEATGAEKIYVTANTQGEKSFQTSEILTLFYDETDALYFQGVSNENKGETLLPYAERFHYVEMTDEVAGKLREEHAAAVINFKEAAAFADDFDISVFGGYCTVYPKS